MILRHIVAPLAGAALCLTFMLQAEAVSRPALVEQFTAEAVGPDDSERAGPIGIYIEEWSTDAEMKRLREPLQRADTAALLTLLHQQQRRVGVLLMPGILGHGARARTRTPKNLLFARMVSTPSGRQLVAIADEHLGLGEPSLEARKTVFEFNLLDVRFGSDGVGVGKIVSDADVAFSPSTGMLEARNYAAHPVRLVDVKVEVGSR